MDGRDVDKEHLLREATFYVFSLFCFVKKPL